LVYPDGGPQLDGPLAPPWKAVLAEIPSTFARLVYLHSLEEQPDRMIGHTHQQVFSQWLGLGLSEQIRDLRDYFEVSRTGLDYRRLVPSNARALERELFMTDMETLFGLLRLEGVTF